MPATDPRLEQLLNGRHIATLGVSRPDGSQQLTPVWYLWEDGALWVPTSSQAAKTKHATTSGKAAREFAHRATASMVGVNIGVAAPMAYFPFGGARDSFFGDLKVHGRDAFEFYTDKKVTISRWS